MTDELEKLTILGYRAVRLDADRIVRQSKHQVLLERVLPLHVGAIILPLAYA